MEALLYLILAVVGFFVLMQLIVRLSGYFKRGKTLPDLKGELGHKINSGKKVLVYFYSPSCGACRPMTPVIDRLRKENKNVFKINVMKDTDLGRTFGIMGTPATVVVQDKKIDKYILGAKNEQFLRGLIN